MKLTPMRYKGYVWPHNPRVYEIGFEQRMAVNSVPFGRYVMQNMGMANRVLKGEGEFVGEDAYTEFKKLATVFYDSTPGILVHPVWQISNAYFVSLSVKQEPKEDYVSYCFEFWESYDGYEDTVRAVYVPQAEEVKSMEASYYTVVRGDTLWGISVRHGMSLGELIALNPQIKNPNLIYTGDSIRVS